MSEQAYLIDGFEIPNQADCKGLIFEGQLIEKELHVPMERVATNLQVTLGLQKNLTYLF